MIHDQRFYGFCHPIRGDMTVPLQERKLRPAAQILNSPHVNSMLNEPRRKGVPQNMRRDIDKAGTTASRIETAPHRS